MAAEPRYASSPAHNPAIDPKWVRQPGPRRHLRERFGVAGSLIHWRDKKSEGRCRMCQRPRAVRALTEHHIVPESWFRVSRKRRLMPIRNVAANKVPLCRPCHDLVEADEHSRAELRRCLAADEVAFAIQCAGAVWFDRRYPRTVRRLG